MLNTGVYVWTDAYSCLTLDRPREKNVSKCFWGRGKREGDGGWSGGGGGGGGGGGMGNSHTSVYNCMNDGQLYGAITAFVTNRFYT